MIEHNGIKVGCLGVVEKDWIDTLGTIEPEDVIYEDMFDSAKKLANELKADGADIVSTPIERRLSRSGLRGGRVVSPAGSGRHP